MLFVNKNGFILGVLGDLMIRRSSDNLLVFSFSMEVVNSFVFTINFFFFISLPFKTMKLNLLYVVKTNLRPLQTHKYEQ